MAKKNIEVLVDDLDGSQADETLSFGLDGVTYEIDLSRRNAKAFRSAMSKHVGVARRTGGRRKTGVVAGAGRRRGSAGGRSSGTAQIRAWAIENGFQVGDRGRISAEVREAYKKAN